MLQRRRYIRYRNRTRLCCCVTQLAGEFACSTCVRRRLILHPNAPHSHRIFRYQAPHAGHSSPHLTRESVRCTHIQSTISVRLPSYRSPACWGHRRNSVRAAQAQSIEMDEKMVVVEREEVKWPEITVFPQLYPTHAAKQNERDEVLSHFIPPVPGYRSLVVAESCLLTKPHNAKSEVCLAPHDATPC